MHRPDPRGRAMLRAYRSAKTSPRAEREALWAHIEASLDDGGLGPGLEPSPEPLPGPARGGLVPVVGVVMAVAAVVVAALALRPGESRDAVARRAPSAATYEAAPREPTPAPQTSTASVPLAAPSASSSTPALAPVVEPSTVSPRRAMPSNDREPLAAAPAPASPVTEAETDELLAELALVREARHALRDDRPARALELLDAHARAFPAGQMREDRHALRIEALCAAGKAPQARAEAQLFLQAFPGSAHAQRVRASCAEP